MSVDDQAFAQTVSSVLADPRSWIGGDEVSLQRIDKGKPDFRISLTSQMTIRDPGYCGFEIPLEASCYNRAVGRVLINDARWERGAMSFNGDLALYRVYAINHEVGHALDFHHQPCADQRRPGAGDDAAVLQHRQRRPGPTGPVDSAGRQGLPGQPLSVPDGRRRGRVRQPHHASPAEPRLSQNPG